MIPKLTRNEILSFLRETDPARLKELFDRADDIRRRTVGDAVHLRGLIEISNVCRCDCLYCGLRKSNSKIERYVLAEDEIFACVQRAVQFGYGTVVLQSGESTVYSADHIAAMIKKIKSTTPLAVTLSLGQHDKSDYALWKNAGADRYLLRHETSDTALINRLRHGASSRIESLRILKELGFETGSGIMIGLPGQTYDSIADDILLFAEFDFDMIGVGPYIPHPNTPLADETKIKISNQVPATELMTVKVVALSRIMCPHANIPATTALGTINKETGRESALQAGANVVMPNLTPPKYRRLYEIYPDKACIEESGEECDLCIKARIHAIAPTIAAGPGSRIK